MPPYFIDKLPEYGLTNLIEVDGLVYAPVSDLWEFFHFQLAYDFGCFLAALASVAAVLWLCCRLGKDIVSMIRNSRKDKNT